MHNLSFDFIDCLAPPLLFVFVEVVPSPCEPRVRQSERPHLVGVTAVCGRVEKCSGGWVIRVRIPGTLLHHCVNRRARLSGAVHRIDETQVGVR